MTHFHIEHGYDSEEMARAAAPVLVETLMRDLKAKGYTTFAAPEMPPTSKQWDGYVEGPCRVLWQYILPFLPSRWADQFAVRVDTLAEAPK